MPLLLRRRFAFVAVTAFGLLACNAILGLDGDTEVRDSNASDASSTDSKATNDGTAADGTAPGNDGGSDANGNVDDASFAYAIVPVSGAVGGLGNGDGVGGEARFDHVSGIASGMAADGSVVRYVLEGAGTLRPSYAIRMIDGDGGVTTLAGKHDEPGLVDGPPATARFLGPKALAYDAFTRRLWVLDSCRLRYVDPDSHNVVTPVGANDTTCITAADDNAAVGLSSNANAIAVAGTNHLYISDPPYVREFNGTSFSAFCGKSSGGADAGLGDCSSVMVRTHELAWTLKSTLVYRPETEGLPTRLREISTLAPAVVELTGKVGAAMFDAGPALATNGTYGQMFLIEAPRQIVFANEASMSVDVLAGSNTEGPNHADGQAQKTRFENLGAIAHDGTAGELVVGDLSTVLTSTGVRSEFHTLAGSASSWTFNPGSATEARFGNAASMTRGDGVVYFYDSLFATVNALDVATKAVTLIAGTPSRPFDGAGAEIKGQLNHNAGGILWDGKRLLISLGQGKFNGSVAEISVGTTDAGTLTTVKTDFSLGAAFTADPTSGRVYLTGFKPSSILGWAGDESEPDIVVGDDANAGFASISGMCWEQSLGGLVVSDRQTSVISTVTFDGSNGAVVTPIAGFTNNHDHTDGNGPAAAFLHPDGVACGGNGLVYVNERATGTIRMIDLNKSAHVTTIAGSGDGRTGIIFGAPGRLNATSSMIALPDLLLVGSANEGAIVGVQKKSASK